MDQSVAYATETLHADDQDIAHDTDEQFFRLSSWLAVDRRDAAAVTAGLPTELKRDATYRDLMDGNGHIDCCYFGELVWRDMHCPHQQNEAMTLIAREATSLKGFATIEQYTWEGNIWDCSIEDSARAILPSTFLQRSAGLRWSGVDRSWFTDTELVVCNADVGTNQGHGTLLMAREDWLQGFLESHDLALVYAVRGERNHRGRGPGDATWVEFELSAAYDQANLITGESEISRKWNQVSRPSLLPQSVRGPVDNFSDKGPPEVP